MKKTRFFLLLTVMLFAMNRASAYDFEVDGIYYNIVSASDKTCSVTYGDEKYIGDVIIPEAVTYKGRTLSVVAIGRSAFSMCYELKSIIIPNSVTEIDDFAFSSCSALKGITIPNSVTGIGRSAFDSCTALTTVKLPNSLTAISYSLFYNCSSLESITIPSSVSSISSSAFKYCSALTNVIFEDGEDELNFYGNETFKDCPLKYLYLGRNQNLNQHSSSDYSPFYYKKTIEKVVVGNRVTKICKDLFSGCSGITSVEIPSSVITIGDGAFANCSGLTSLVIPNNVVEINNYAFKGCTGIETLIIEDGETPLELGYGKEANYWWSYSYGMFYYAPLKTLYCGRNITEKESCGSPWLGGSKTLKEVTIGNNVSSIPSSWFSYCEVLENMWLLNSVPLRTYSDAFTNSQYLNLNVYVPQGSLSAYQNADVWKDFWNLQEGAPTGIESVKNITPNAKNCYYDLRGNRLSAPKRGLNIINGKKVIVK